MFTSARSTALVIFVASSLLILSGCASEPDASMSGDVSSGGSGGSSDSGVSESGSDATEGSGQALAQAARDGMPELGLTGCPETLEYEYNPTSGNTVWHFTFACASRDAFDASVATLMAEGYDPSPSDFTTGSIVSERNHFQADANGGSTEVQLNITGSPDEIKYEIYVTLTLP